MAVEQHTNGAMLQLNQQPQAAQPTSAMNPQANVLPALSESYNFDSINSIANSLDNLSLEPGNDINSERDHTLDRTPAVTSATTAAMPQQLQRPEPPIGEGPGDDIGGLAREYERYPNHRDSLIRTIDDINFERDFGQWFTPPLQRFESESSRTESLMHLQGQGQPPPQSMSTPPQMRNPMGNPLLDGMNVPERLDLNGTEMFFNPDFYPNATPAIRNRNPTESIMHPQGQGQPPPQMRNPTGNPPLNGMNVPGGIDPSLLNESNMFFSPDFIEAVARSMDEMDTTEMFRNGDGYDFERDFGQWFSPDGLAGGLDNLGTGTDDFDDFDFDWFSSYRGHTKRGA